MAFINNGIKKTAIVSTENKGEVNSSPISFDIKEVDFLVRKFSELTLSTKELQVGFNVMLKLQELHKRIMESKIEIE